MRAGFCNNGIHYKFKNVRKSKMSEVTISRESAKLVRMKVPLLSFLAFFLE